MANNKDSNFISHYGSIAGAVMAILALVGFLGKPHLEDFIEAEIKKYDTEEKADESKKTKLRRLLGDKMEVADDEVHIEIGKLYKGEKDVKNVIDSLQGRVKYLEQEVKLNFADIQGNYTKINAINKKLEKHGLFH